MSEKRTAHILKEDSVRFFNLIASLPDWRRKSEYERQTEKESNVLRDQEIHEEDLRNIRKLVQDNPQMSMEQAAELYYESKGMAEPAMKYERGNSLVDSGPVNQLSTYMRDLHEYYQAQTLEIDASGFEVIIRPPLVFYYDEEVKIYVEWECLFQLYQKRDLDTQMLTLWTM